MLLRDLLREYTFECKIRKLADTTIETYNYNANQFFMFLEKEHEIIEVEDVSTVHMKMFVEYNLSQGHSPGYINALIKSLRSFYIYLVSEEYISINIAKRVNLLKEETVIIKTFTHEEVARMIDCYDFKKYLNARNKVIVAMFSDTGIRMCELIGLKESWIDDTHMRVLGKGNKWRVVPISLVLHKYMIRYERIKDKYFQRIDKKHDNYFLSKSGKKLSSVMIQTIVKEAGEVAKVRSDIRCSPHTLRHYALQTYLSNGLDLYSCSRIAGHEKMQTTKRYLQGIESENIIEMALTKSPLMKGRR